MCNLLHNPSFEVGLDGWEFENVTLDSLNAFEGTRAARMGSGIASIYQDVDLTGTGSGPMLISFSALSGYDSPARPEGGSLVVELIWMSISGNAVGTGLKLLMQPSMLCDNHNKQLTYIEVTNRRPVDAAMARLQFSKGNMNTIEKTSAENPVLIDQVILAPLENTNIISNPAFEKRLYGWNIDNSTASGELPYEGTNDAVLDGDGLDAEIIFQDVPLEDLPVNSSFLLSFAAREGGDLLVAVEYRNNVSALGTGLSLLIPARVLNQGGWKTFAIAVEKPVPADATIAHVSFEGIFVRVGKVNLVPIKSPNLILNPSFEDGLNGWTSENITLVSGNSYEGAYSTRGVNSAYIFQNVNISPDTGCCYLLTFGAQAASLQSDALAEVIWLDAEGRELGLGTSLVIPEAAVTSERQDGSLDRNWATFVSVTEPSPPEAAAAQILFSNANSSPLELDMVSFSRISCFPPSPDGKGTMIWANGQKHTGVFRDGQVVK